MWAIIVDDGGFSTISHSVAHHSAVNAARLNYHVSVLISKMSWSSEECFKFIEFYQSEPVIWNPLNKDHKDRTKVNDAWERISDAMDIPVIEIKKKKETLMSAFRMHLKKKLASIKSGTSEDENYKPFWIYYDAMEAFLRPVYESSSIINTEDNIKMEFDNPTKSNSLGKRSKTNTAQEEDNIMAKCLESISTKSDENEAFAQYIAVKLRKVENQQQKMYAEMLITKILNNAIMNKLNDHTDIS